MLTIEEYIARRKKEDRLNEFDVNERIENMKTCVNYVFEYFNNYLNISKAEEKTALKEEKVDKYRQQLRDYDEEVREWLVSMYAEYGKQMHKHIGRLLEEDQFFYLFNSDKEFRSVSYDCYSKLIKKLPFLKEQTEMLFLFIKEYHRVKSEPKEEFNEFYISEGVNEWIQQTWLKYQVNVLVYAYSWADYFYENEKLWPATHRLKSQSNFRKYDYDVKQKSNLFNLDSLYRKMPKKAFTKGRKQEFEILIMYYWLHYIAGDESYWQEYLSKTLPFLKNEESL